MAKRSNGSSRPAKTLDSYDDGQGRLPGFEPVGVVDIGSNSVRLVVYDAARRSPTPVYNEKVLCGLGRGVATTGRMNDANIDMALSTLRRFNALNRQIGVQTVYAVATAAAREAENGAAFIEDAQDALGASIKVLTGKREARLAAYGVLAGIPGADGLVGDLGGGSLELIRVAGGKAKKGVTLPLGPLRLLDTAQGSRSKAARIIDRALDGLELLDGLNRQNFYAVGGTWRNLARLHMGQSDYPLSVLHHYEIPRREMRDFAKLIARQSDASLRATSLISANRAETLPLGCEILARLLSRIKARDVVVSAYGVREGLIYSKLKRTAMDADPLISAARDLARLRSRSLRHAEELCAWSDRLFKSYDKSETAREKTLRHASCLMADIGWRANQDYRGEQSLNIIANAAMGGVSHAERAFLALTVYFRYGRGATGDVSPRLLELVDERAIARARAISAVQRLAYVLSGAMPGILPDARLKIVDDELQLKLPKKYHDLWGVRVERRLIDLGFSMGKRPRAKIAGKRHDPASWLGQNRAAG